MLPNSSISCLAVLLAACPIGCNPDQSTKPSANDKNSGQLIEGEDHSVVALEQLKGGFFHRGKHWFNESTVNSRDWILTAYTDGRLYCGEEMEVCLLLDSTNPNANLGLSIPVTVAFFRSGEKSKPISVIFNARFERITLGKNKWEAILKQPTLVPDKDGDLCFFPGNGRWSMEITMTIDEERLIARNMTIRREIMPAPSPPRHTP
jgi:hypothetical protein